MAYIIQTNKLYGKPEGRVNLQQAKGVYALNTNDELKHVLIIKNGTQTVFEAYRTFFAYDYGETEVYIPSTGVTDVRDYLSADVQSCTYNYADMVMDQLDWTCDVESIAENTSTSTKTGEINLTQDVTGDVLTLYYEQAGLNTSYVYSDPEFVTIYQESDVLANGVGTDIQVEYKQIRQTLSNGSVTEELEVTGTVSPTSAIGEALIEGATYSEGYVEGPDCGMTETERRSIYKITEVTFEANGGKTGTAVVDFDVYQEANSYIDTEETNIKVILNVNPKYIEATGGSVTATPNCTSEITYVYTSGRYPQGEVNHSVQLSAPGSTLEGMIEVESGKPSTLVYGANEGETSLSRDIYAQYKEKTAKETISQYGTSYVFTKFDSDKEINSRAQTVYVRVTSLKQGAPLAIDEDCVSISGISGATINQVSAWDTNEGVYAAFIDIPENTSNTERTLTVTFTQPTSGSEVVYTITQDVVVVTEEDTDPVFVSLSYDDIPANGDGGLVKANWETSHNIYHDGELESTTTTPGTSDITDIKVTALIDGAGYDITNGLYAPNRLKEEGDARNVLTITSVTFTAGTTEITQDVNSTVVQEKNTKTAGTATHTVNLTSKTTSLTNQGGQVTLDVTAYKTIPYTYSSGSTDNEYENESVYVQANNTATFNGASGVDAVNGQTLYAQVGVNGGVSARDVVFTATNDYDSATLTISQAGAGYTFEITGTQNLEPTAAKSTGYVVVNSKKNDNLFAFDTSATSSNANWLSVISVDEATSAYYVTFECAKNTSTNSRTGIVTITQPESETKLQFTVTQAGDSTSIEYSDPTVTSISGGAVNAAGKGSLITVNWEQVKTVVHTNGDTEPTTLTGSSRPSEVTYTEVVSESGYNTTDGTYAPSRGKTEGDVRTVITITKVKFATEVATPYEVTVDHDVTQQANVKTVNDSTTSVTLKSDKTVVTHAGGTVSLTPTATRTEGVTYTSGESDTIVTDLTVSLTIPTSNASFLPSGGVQLNVPSGSTATAQIGTNSGTSSRTITFKAVYGEYSDSISITQDGAAFEFYVQDNNHNDITADACEAYSRVISKKNGSPHVFTISNASSNASWLTVYYVGNWDSAGLQVVQYKLTANDSTEERTGVITLTQPDSGKTATISVTQPGKTIVEEDDVTVHFDAGHDDTSYSSVNFTITLTGTGTINDVKVALSQTSMDADTYNILEIGELTSPTVYTNTIENTAGLSTCTVDLYYNGEIQQTVNLT